MARGVIKGIVEAANKGLGILDSAVTDKNKVLEVKQVFEELKQEAELAARTMYETELSEIKGPVINFIRALPRPFIAMAATGIWIFSVISTVSDKINDFPIDPFSAGIIMAVVSFYFITRHAEKKERTKFFEKWGL